MTVTIDATTSSPWTVTTRDDEEPDAFAFGDVLDASPDTDYVSTAVTLSGFSGELSATVLERPAAGALIKNGIESTSGTVDVRAGDTLAIAMRSPATYAASRSTAVMLGPVVVTWTLTTRARDTAPDAFMFEDVGDVPLGSPIAAEVTGFMPGDTIAIRHFSSPIAATTTTASVTVGDATSMTWTVSTPPVDTEPNVFSFNSESPKAPGTLVTTNAVTLTGFDGPLEVPGGVDVALSATCSGNCSAIARNGVWGGTTVSGFLPV